MSYNQDQRELSAKIQIRELKKLQLQLQEEFKLNKAPQNYLISRRFNPDKAIEFGIGYANRPNPSDYPNLNPAIPILINYRLTIPIYDTKGRIIAYAGRIITNNPNQPKYINTPDSILFKKSQKLYGLNWTKEYITQQDHVIITEGYWDTITLYRKGIKNSVATMGTAISPYQLHILSRYTNTIVSAFDQDQAGIKATNRLKIAVEKHNKTGNKDVDRDTTSGNRARNKDSYTKNRTKNKDKDGGNREKPRVNIENSRANMEKSPDPVRSRSKSVSVSTALRVVELDLPDGFDPAEYVERYGGGKFRARVLRALAG